jgi:hypothetical protein
MSDFSGILNSIRSGSGFTNPISNAISTTVGAFNIPSVSELQAAATAQSLVTGLPVPPAGEIVAAQAAIVNTVNSINSLIGHSDRISGVDLTGNGTLATIAKTMGAARKSNGEKSCATVLGAFGTIAKAQQYIDEVQGVLETINQFKNNVAANIAGMTAAAGVFVTKVAEQILSDTAALANAQLQLAEAAVASSVSSLVQDECMAAIMSSVMSQGLKNEVNKVIESEALKFRKARFGY